MNSTLKLTASVCIPTYQREADLIETIEAAIKAQPLEIIVVDQTHDHDEMTIIRLNNFVDEGKIRLFRLDNPSLPNARNLCLAKSVADIVIFIDDDVLFEPNFVDNHLAAYGNPNTKGVAGRVTQMRTGRVLNGHKLTNTPIDYDHVDLDSQVPLRSVWTFQGCNHSVDRNLALSLGGYDINFTGVALREDLDMALRIRLSGYNIAYIPDAHTMHKQALSGGCRRANAFDLSCGKSQLYFAIKHARLFKYHFFIEFFRGSRAFLINKDSIRSLPAFFWRLVNYLPTVFNAYLLTLGH